MFDWLDHLEIAYTASTYLDLPNHAPRTLIRDPLAIVGEEMKLRQLEEIVEADTLLLSRNASPFSTGTLEARLLGRASHGVYDFDDALYAYPRNGAKRLFSKARVWRRAIQAADMVIAGNETLAERAAALNRRVTVIPSCVEPNDYLQKDNYSIRRCPRLVWLGSPSTEKYLARLQGPLLRLHRTLGARVWLISAGTRSLGALDKMIDRVAWDHGGLGSYLADADVGLAPLTDDEFTRGKCAYKLLQYGAAGLPVIGDPVGINAEVLRKFDGLAPTSLDEWFQGLSQLFDETDSRRAERGRRASSVCAADYSFAAWTSEWVRAVGIE